MVLGLVGNSEDEVDDDGQEKDDGQNSRAETVIETGLSLHSYRLGSPVVGYECVDHGTHSDAGEEKRRDKGDSVTEIEHTNGKGAQDDGEVEP